jgi:hypothetical protein
MGRECLGEQNILSSSELKDVIGWNFLQQLNGFSMGFYRRAKRRLSYIS